MVIPLTVLGREISHGTMVLPGVDADTMGPRRRWFSPSILMSVATMSLCVIFLQSCVQGYDEWFQR